MKPATFVTALALAATTGYLVATRFPPTPVPSTATPVAPASPLAPARDKFTPAQIAALASGDAARLQAAGLPDHFIRLFAAALAAEKYSDVLKQHRAKKAANPRYWRESRPDNETVAENAAQKEFDAAMNAAFGTTFAALETVEPSSRFDFLSAEKRALIDRIQKDYAEMRAEIRNKAAGLSLPSDRAKLDLLEKEKDRDILAAMTPTERAQDELRSSDAARSVINRFGDLIDHEDDYKKIFALRKALEEQWAAQGPPSGARPTPEQLAANRAASTRFNTSVIALLGADQVAAYQRAHDPENETLGTLTARLNLPDSTPAAVLAARDRYGAQSLLLAQDSTLSAQDRLAQLKNLATQAEIELQRTLGSEGATAYRAQANWLRFLKDGDAFTTNLKDSPVDSFSSNTPVRRIPTPRPAPAIPTKG